MATLLSHRLDSRPTTRGDSPFVERRPRAPRQPGHNTAMDLELRNQRVLITGGSRGIGLACAAGFLREGARVAIVSRSAENLAKACARLAEGEGEFAKD